MRRELAARWLAITFGLLPLGAAPAIAQSPTPAAAPTPSAGSAAGIPPEAAAPLAKAAGVYADGSAHAATFTQIYTPAGFATSRRESGTVWIQSPDRLRFD